MDAVMLSVAKHLWPELQILRFAQDDNSSASVCQRTRALVSFDEG
jgi:hypothetical protein